MADLCSQFTAVHWWVVKADNNYNYHYVRSRDNTNKKVQKICVKAVEGSHPGFIIYLWRKSVVNIHFKLSNLIYKPNNYDYINYNNYLRQDVCVGTM